MSKDNTRISVALSLSGSLFEIDFIARPTAVHNNTMLAIKVKSKIKVELSKPEANNNKNDMANKPKPHKKDLTLRVA